MRQIPAWFVIVGFLVMAWALYETGYQAWSDFAARLASLAAR